MNVPDQFLDAGNNYAPTHQPYANNAIRHLIVGLERQKEELGPIADELISLLHRLGVSEIAHNVVAATPLPQAKPKG